MHFCLGFEDGLYYIRELPKINTKKNHATSVATTIVTEATLDGCGFTTFKASYECSQPHEASLTQLC